MTAAAAVPAAASSQSWLERLLADPHVRSVSLYWEDRRQQDFGVRFRATTWCTGGHGTHDGLGFSQQTPAMSIGAAVADLVRNWSDRPACGGCACGGAGVLIETPKAELGRQCDDEAIRAVGAIFAAVGGATAVSIQKGREATRLSVVFGNRGSIVKTGPDIRTAAARVLTFLDTMEYLPRGEEWDALRPSEWAAQIAATERARGGLP